MAETLSPRDLRASDTCDTTVFLALVEKDSTERDTVPAGKKAGAGLSRNWLDRAERPLRRSGTNEWLPPERRSTESHTFPTLPLNSGI